MILFIFSNFIVVTVDEEKKSLKKSFECILQFFFSGHLAYNLCVSFVVSNKIKELLNAQRIEKCDDKAYEMSRWKRKRIEKKREINLSISID